MYKVRKRNGKLVNFEINKISEAMKKAFEASEKTYDNDVIDFLAIKVTSDFESKVKDNDYLFLRDSNKLKKTFNTFSEFQTNYTKGNGDQDSTNTGFAKRLLRLVDGEDKEPYFFMIAVGSNAKQGNAGKTTNTVHDKYTVYYAFYKETADSPNWFYYNGEWTRTNPRATGTIVLNDYNVITSGSLKGKRLQYYIISNHTKYTKSFDSSGFWDWVKKQE